MRPLLATLLLLPGLAFAQTLTLTVNGAGTSGVLAYNASGCGFAVAGTWTGASLTAACTPLTIWTTAFTCGTTGAPSTTNSPPDYTVTTVPASSLTSGSTTNGAFSFAFNTLPSFSVSGQACGTVVDFTNYLCAGVTLAAAGATCNGSIASATPVNIRYDNVPPIPPIVTITPLDSQLSVSLAPGDASDTISSYLVGYTIEPADGGTPGSYTGVGGTIPANNARTTISNLVNGTNYLVVGYSVDEASNVSVSSTPVVGTPVVTLGFYANYINDGGYPSGGCGDAAGGGPSTLAFATLALLVLARRRG
jgi:hypothetical protein